MAATNPANPYVRNHTSGELIKRFWPYERKYWKIVLTDLFCASLTTVCDLVLPLIVRTITNLGATDLPALTVSMVVRMSLLYILLRVVDKKGCRTDPDASQRLAENGVFIGRAFGWFELMGFPLTGGVAHKNTESLECKAESKGLIRVAGFAVIGVSADAQDSGHLSLDIGSAPEKTGIEETGAYFKQHLVNQDAVLFNGRDHLRRS